MSAHGEVIRYFLSDEQLAEVKRKYGEPVAPLGTMRSRAFEVKPIEKDVPKFSMEDYLEWKSENKSDTEISKENGIALKKLQSWKYRWGLYT